MWNANLSNRTNNLVFTCNLKHTEKTNTRKYLTRNWEKCCITNTEGFIKYQWNKITRA